MASNRVRAELERLEKSQSWLSQQTGIHASQISGICNGSTCSIRNAVRIAKALDVPVEDLFPVDESAA